MHALSSYSIKTVFHRCTESPTHRFIVSGQRKRIENTMAKANSDDDEYSKRWEIMWNGGNQDYEVKNGDGGALKPGQSFDAGRSCPQLDIFLEQNKGMLEGGTAVIPGCGRGYDVATFSKYCKEVVGLELAPTAVASAQEYLGDSYKNVSVILGDFLKDTGKTQYDIGYDYTFFCALHPDMRDSWASSWAANIRPEGLLITLIFPVLPEELRGQAGPPWPVWPELYSEYLEKHGFSLHSLEKVPDSGSHPGREGKEYIGVWKRMG